MLLWPKDGGSLSKETGGGGGRGGGSRVVCQLVCVRGRGRESRLLLPPLLLSPSHGEEERRKRITDGGEGGRATEPRP